MGLLYCMQQLLCHFEFLVLVLGHPCPLFDARLYYNQTTEEEWNTQMPRLCACTTDSLRSRYKKRNGTHRCPGYVHVPLTHFEVVIRRGMEHTDAQVMYMYH